MTDGGPAFPRNVLDHGHGITTTHESGMSLRDYFAAKAMQALVRDNYFDVVATRAYLMADAMLKERLR